MLPVRWLSDKNLHITLVPPWHEESIERAKTVLQTIEGKFGPIELFFTNISFGPDPRRPRLIWLTGEPSERLRELVLLLEEFLGEKEQSSRQIRDGGVPHVTLARFREEDFGSFPRKEINERVKWKEEARSVVLMESHLSPAGADYEALYEVGL